MLKVSLKKLNQIQKISLLFSTLFGIGFLKPAPGTYGSIFGFIFIFINYNFFINILIFIFLFLLSYFSIRNIESLFPNDPPFIIVDEFLGMGMILLFNESINSPLLYFISFILFRLFDILKPFPINWLNKKSGALYIILDDILAGIFVLIIIKSILFIFNIGFLINFLNFLQKI